MSAQLLNHTSEHHETSYKYQPALDDVQSARTVTLAFIFFWVISLWILSLTKSCLHRVRSITFKPYKLASWNFIQISTSNRRRAECKNSNSCIYIFWVISLLTLSLTKSCLCRVRSITFKPYKLASWSFIQISTIIRGHAECKNHNSCIYTFWVISHGTSTITKLHLNRVRSTTWKAFKLSSWIFIQISTNIRWHAEFKNCNSCINAFWVIAFGTLSVKKLCLYGVRTITWKLFKLFSCNFYKYQSTLDDVQSARTITLAFTLFE